MVEQSAEDINCKTEDFLKNQNVIVPFRLGKKARKYLKEPIIANFVSYGNNVVASVTEDVREIVTEYVYPFDPSKLQPPLASSFLLPWP